MKKHVLTFETTLYSPNGRREFQPQHIEAECDDDELDLLVSKTAREIQKQLAAQGNYARVCARCVAVTVLDTVDDDSDDEERSESNGSNMTLPNVSPVLMRSVERAFKAIGQPFILTGWKIRWLDLLDGETEHQGEVAALESLLHYRSVRMFDGCSGEQKRPLAWAVMKVFVEELGHAEARSDLVRMQKEMTPAEFREASGLLAAFRE